MKITDEKMKVWIENMATSLFEVQDIIGDINTELAHMLCDNFFENKEKEQDNEKTNQL